MHDKGLFAGYSGEDERGTALDATHLTRGCRQRDGTSLVDPMVAGRFGDKHDHSAEDVESQRLAWSPVQGVEHGALTDATGAVDAGHPDHEVRPGRFDWSGDGQVGQVYWFGRTLGKVGHERADQLFLGPP